MKKKSSLTKIVIFLAALSLTSACVKTLQNVGYSPEINKINSLVAGQTRKAVVKRELGSPSAISTYGIETWYYISTEKESIAFFEPKIKSQTVVAIQFNEDQTIANIKKYDEKDARNIKIDKQVTKTEGHEQGVLGQFLGNVGRFNTDRRDTATTP